MKSNRLKLILGLAAVVLLTAFFSLELSLAPIHIAVFVLLYSLSVAGSLFVSPSFSCASLAFGSCLLPLFHPLGIDLMCTLWSGAALARSVFDPSGKMFWRRNHPLLLLAILLFLLPIILGAFTALLLRFDLPLMLTLVMGGGKRALIGYGLQNFTQNAEVLRLACGYTAAALFALVFLRTIDSEQRCPRAFFTGLSCGCIFAALTFVFQHEGAVSIFSRNFSEFWRMQGRYPASFTDPNAFGVFSALVLPPLFIVGVYAERYLYVVASSFLLAVVPWSGSRSFWLGLICWSLCWWMSMRPTKRRRLHFALIVLSLTAAAIVFGYPPVNERLRQLSHLPSVDRMLQTVHWNEGGEMFYSRSLYAELAMTVARLSPVVGVGLTRFYHEQEAAARSIGIDLQGWRDNANNFYFQVCAELGLVGFTIILVSFYLFWFALRGESRGDYWRGKLSDVTTRQLYTRLARFGLFTTVVLFFTGPHIHFSEIRFLVAAFIGLAGAGVTFADDKHVSGFTWSAFYGLAIAASLITVMAWSQQRFPLQGAYAKEHGENGFFFWTGKEAQLLLCGAEPESFRLMLRAHNPDLKENPLKALLTVTTIGGERAEKEITFVDTEWKEISLPPLTQPSYRLRLKISVDRIWSPSESNPEGDRRWLGVMTKIPPSLCDLHRI